MVTILVVVGKKWKPFYAAIREGTEELNGFFGSEEDLEELNYKSVLTLNKLLYFMFLVQNTIENYQNILTIIINLLKNKIAIK